MAGYRYAKTRKINTYGSLGLKELKEEYLARLQNIKLVSSWITPHNYKHLNCTGKDCKTLNEYRNMLRRHNNGLEKIRMTIVWDAEIETTLNQNTKEKIVKKVKNKKIISKKEIYNWSFLNENNV